MKFGGTSVGSADSMRQAAGLVAASLDRSPLVVLSAMAKVTNRLFQAARLAKEGNLEASLLEMNSIAERHTEVARQLLANCSILTELELTLLARFNELELLLRGVALLKELTDRSMDAIASLGERLSTPIFVALLRSQGVDAVLVDARQIMRTDDQFGGATPRLDEIRGLAAMNLLPQLTPGRAVITQGYIGSTEDGLSTTLGRGGSDYSASLFGAAINAPEVQIWTDVPGVLTCDPRIVPVATPISRLSFAEAAELAAFGASVLHPATIQPAVDASIPVTVRDTHDPQGNFTTISNDHGTGRPVTALACRDNTTVLTVTSTRMLHQVGFLNRLFEAVARHKISVDLIATAEVSVSMTVDSTQGLKGLLPDLSKFATVTVSEGRAIIAIVGERLQETAGLGARIFKALESINVEMISMGASKLNLSVVVREESKTEALKQLHSELFERS